MNQTHESSDICSTANGTVPPRFAATADCIWINYKEKLAVAQLIKKLPGFYWTRGFIAVFTTACHLSLSWARHIQHTLNSSLCLRHILILSPMLCLGIPTALIPSSVSIRILCVFLTTPTRAMRPANLIQIRRDPVWRNIAAAEFRTTPTWHDDIPRGLTSRGWLSGVCFVRQSSLPSVCAVHKLCHVDQLTTETPTTRCLLRNKTALGGKKTDANWTAAAAR